MSHSDVGLFGSSGDDQSIEAIKPSPMTAVFTPSADGAYPRLDSTLGNPVNTRIYIRNIKSCAPKDTAEPDKFEEGLKHAPMEVFFRYSMQGQNVISKTPDLNTDDVVKTIKKMIVGGDHVTYAIIRDKETGEIALSLGGSSAHAISSMDSRIGDYFKKKCPNLLSEKQCDAFTKQREQRFEVLAAGDMRLENKNQDSERIIIDNQSGAYPDAYLAGLDFPKDVEKGRKNTMRALHLFGLDQYFVPFEPKIEKEAKNDAGQEEKSNYKPSL